MKSLEVARNAQPQLLWLLGRLFLVLHLILMPVFWLAASVCIPVVIGLSEAAFHEMDMGEEHGVDENVICLFAPDPYTGFYPLVMRQFLGYPPPKTWQALSLAPFAHEVTRTATNRFEIRVAKGELLSTPFERLMRSENFPYKPNDVVPMKGFSIEVLEVGEWGPRRFAVTFEYPLEDARYRFLAWQDGRLSRVTWPPIGESQVFSAADGYFAWQHFKKRLPVL